MPKRKKTPNHDFLVAANFTLVGSAVEQGGTLEFWAKKNSSGQGVDGFLIDTATDKILGPMTALPEKKEDE